MKIWIMALTSFLSFVILPPTSAGTKPPQFVVISFDNCTEIDRWQQLTDFLDVMDQQNKSIHLTFFVSGTNFLTDANHAIYQGPNHLPGEAKIPFGGTKKEVETRAAFINALYLRGNEIGSHAVGHFDGSKWTKADWEKEFKSYHQLFDKFVLNNHLTPSAKFVFNFNEIQGFRAPYLGVNPELYTVLKLNHFRYDASGISHSNDWPIKKDGLWHFDLVRLKIAGTDKKTISMDYNFYMAQTKAKEDPSPTHQKKYQQQILDTYMNYFMANYKGNRAPLRIGHHFTNFENGIYNKALFEFAKQVCGLPDVRCVSFKELADFMDTLSESDLNSYQKGML